jgi:uncharacterized glyoxalase superfamily protein PhnB
MSYTTRKITAVLVVSAVEPSLEFWERRLAFTKVAEVPHGDALGFAMLVKDGTEVMLQSEASVRADMTDTMAGGVIGTSTVLYVEVDDLAAAEAALAGYPIALPRRTTFYGMTEFGVLEPGGHLVVFAQQGP